MWKKIICNDKITEKLQTTRRLRQVDVIFWFILIHCFGFQVYWSVLINYVSSFSGQQFSVNKI